MDMYLSNFATCFPMITKLSIVQLDLDVVKNDTLAINFVVCKPLDYHITRWFLVTLKKIELKIYG